MTDGGTVELPAVACIEVGGGGVETVVLGGPAPLVRSGARPPDGLPLLLAVPGVVVGSRVVGAANLGWYDVDPVEMLGLSRPAALICNDAEAAALGEAVLRGARGLAGLAYLGLGTGVGGAVVDAGTVVGANLFGHHPGFGDRGCRCGANGCLETVAAGWALPEPLDDVALRMVAAAVARAVDAEPLASGKTLVVGGGLVRRYPRLVDLVAATLPARAVEPSCAPADLKSAAAYGLAHAFGTADAAA